MITFSVARADETSGRFQSKESVMVSGHIPSSLVSTRLPFTVHELPVIQLSHTVLLGPEDE